jgi:penicillin-binding protein 1C
VVNSFRKSIHFVKNILSKKYIRFPLLFITGGVILFFILNFLFPLKTEIKYSQIITADDGTVLHSFLTADQKWRMKSELADLSPVLKTALIAKEDQWFYYHLGINPLAICRAAVMNIFSNRRTSGASTITMQVVRMLHPAPRTYIHKCKEMFRALQLEYMFSKDEILQLYCNLVPYGGNIEGVKAASILYFGKLPNFLSVAQVAMLTVIPNKPTSMRPGKNDIQLLAFRNKWLLELQRREVFSAKEVADALKEPLLAKRISPPKQLPHFSNYIRRIYPDSPVINSTISKYKQAGVERITFNYMNRLKKLNIKHAAVFMLDNRTGKVQAYLGSPDFYDKMNNGEVDGVQAIRSPGSTLKPLVYAINFDEGLLTPKTIIYDVPSSFDGYEPENFNSKFNGKVTVEKALAFSLNIPAVKALDKIGKAMMTDKLTMAGFNQLKVEEKKLGLSMILGGCGVSLFQLTGMYSVFANDGIYRKPQFLRSQMRDKGTPIITAASAFMVSDILTQPIRPDLPNNYQNSMHLPKVAWKTGTSYGRRDAWCIGFNKNYTIGVWVGNFSGEGVPELTGAEMATPLLFELFNLFQYNANDEWLHVPKSLGFRLVCNETGLLPSDLCENQIADYYIPGKSSQQVCSHLKTVSVSANEAFSYCTSCRPEAGYKKVNYPNYPPELATYFEKEHINYKRMPPHNPECNRVFNHAPPHITSPLDGKEYLMEKGMDKQLMLECQTASEVKYIYWYVNDRFVKTALANEKVFIEPPSGQVKISCSDDQGRSSDIKITVSDF